MLSIISLLVIPFKLQMLGVGLFTFAVWYFVLRKYRSLGLRMFFLCSMVAVFGCCWLYSDVQANRSMETNGHLLTATVLTKAKSASESGASKVNGITVSFEYPAGKLQTLSTTTYISDGEYDALHTGQQIEILYNPTNQQAFYTVSFNRYKNDQWFMYLFPAFFFVLGLAAFFFLRKYKVGIHEDTGDEYLEKDGKIILDERGNEAARTLKRVNIISKILQATR